ncbi:hypothetical protein GCM10025865_19390 [Paraoerskovia sediminicola]|uniref:Protein kinase domain-containing protein n=1 Tax=Paraoerskovia sediminicola TaxID=1138587 RepID=A0ABN6XD89_9CELL|nr:serine/threonine-protein kinase [Paraoerskovia sediminicola]BDZ42640.1 hypothetical protein GCM10025865_19390 [Paraoerskovia sediminicola]
MDTESIGTPGAPAEPGSSGPRRSPTSGAEPGGLPPGTEIDGYTIVSRLGSGAMGTVYRATDGGGQEVALKLLHSHVDADTSALGRERLRREAVALQKLDHPAVAAILDVELEGADAFIVTQIAEGISLEDEIAERGPLDADDLLALAEQLAEALEAVHAAGVVHRDMKPSNVLVTDDGPVLIDFGIAHGLEDARMTSTGLVMGTPGYLDPQLLSGAEPGTATDWWGWAAMLAYAATGRPPFGVRPLDAVLARARSGDADLAGLGARTHGALAAALNPEPRRRLGPAQVVRALRTAATEGDPAVEDGGISRGQVAAAAGAFAAGAAVTQVVASDGGTRPMVVGPPSDGAGDGTYADPAAYSEGGDRAAYGQPEAAAGDPAGEGASQWQGYERPRPARRPWAVLGIGVALVAFAGSAPGVAFALLAVLVILARWVGLMTNSLHARREARGSRRGTEPGSVGCRPSSSCVRCSAPRPGCSSVPARGCCSWSAAGGCSPPGGWSSCPIPRRPRGRSGERTPTGSSRSCSASRWPSRRRSRGSAR